MNTTQSHPAKRHRWRLAALTALVLLAHWALLRAAPLHRETHEKPATDPVQWGFSTRILPPEPAPLATERRAAAPQPATPRPPAVNVEKKPAAAAAAPVEYNHKAIESVALPPAPSSAIAQPPQLLAAATPEAPARASVTRATPRIAIPPPTRLKYEIKGEVKGFPYSVNAELVWMQDGTTYNARMEMSHFLLGSRVQTSTGQLTRNGLEPTRFGDKVRSEVAAHFVRDKNKVSFSANTPDVPLQSGAQDQLSVFIQLAALFAGDPKGFAQGSTLPFQAIGPRSAESWVFTVGTQETLEMPGGAISAVRLWRDPTGEFDPKAEIWLAPDVGYLPVRIRLTQPNGDFVDQQWLSTQR
jgi:hypothetical protein